MANPKFVRLSAGHYMTSDKGWSIDRVDLGGGWWWVSRSEADRWAAFDLFRTLAEVRKTIIEYDTLNQGSANGKSQAIR